MKEEHPQIPTFAVGHSMVISIFIISYPTINLINLFLKLQGGMILLAAALKEPSAWDGVVLMGPLIHIDPALASPVKLWAARVLSRVTPQLAVRYIINNNHIITIITMYRSCCFFFCECRWVPLR